MHDAHASPERLRLAHGADPPDGDRRPRRRARRDRSSVGPYTVIGAARAHRRGHDDRPALRDRGPHHDRPRQPHLPVRVDRRACRRTRSTPASRPSWRSATATRSASSAPSTSARAQDGGVTRIGDDNWIMAYVHIAHDCQVGNHTILANNATLAGHVHLGDWVIVGGLTGMHQFVQGRRARDDRLPERTSSQDVPPFMMVDGNPLAVRGFNVEGLRRRGFYAERDRRRQADAPAAVPRGPDARRRRARRSPRWRGEMPEAARRRRADERLPRRAPRAASRAELRRCR